MKGTIAAFDTLFGRAAAAFVRDGVLEDLLIDPPADRIRPGSVYRARAQRQMKGQGGIFVDTPDGPLFLRQAKGVSPGQLLLVQTTTFAERGKAAPATLRLSIKGRYGLVTPGAPGLNISRSIRDETRRMALHRIASELVHDEDLGLIVRSAASDADDDAIRDDLAALLEAARAVVTDESAAPARLLDGPDARELAYREWPIPDLTDAAPGAFDRHGIMEMVETAQSHVQRLPEGASLSIEATRALVAVDIDTGGDSSPAAGLKVNIAAMRALPRLLRLRGLGGQIVVDMAPMPKRDRVRVEQQIKSAFRSDPIETSFVGWTPLGHAELQRKRERLPVEETTE